ncbi:MAG: hypothetical protein CMN90_07835 [Sutterellaceae bacterium]|nr:hypothetical protein [Sutterellaceae bacterium]|tara:strand:- start:35 stop:355 length:321 start_codon:yes stop_codon:yes gene_type:complete
MKVLHFSSTAKFDYLTMMVKLGFANIQVDYAYLSTSTRPKRGAKLLFGDDLNSAKYADHELDRHALRLTDSLKFGFQEIGGLYAIGENPPENIAGSVAKGGLLSRS